MEQGGDLGQGREAESASGAVLLGSSSSPLAAQRHAPQRSCAQPGRRRAAATQARWYICTNRFCVWPCRQCSGILTKRGPLLGVGDLCKAGLISRIPRGRRARVRANEDGRLQGTSGECRGAQGWVKKQRPEQDAAQRPRSQVPHSSPCLWVPARSPAPCAREHTLPVGADTLHPP